MITLSGKRELILLFFTLLLVYEGRSGNIRTFCFLKNRSKRSFVHFQSIVDEAV